MAVLRSAAIAALLAICTLALAPHGAQAQGTPVHDHQLKAVFLYNFANFVSWPAQAFDGPRSPIKYCFLGDGPIGDALEQTLQGEAVNGRALVLQRAPGLGELKGCHVVFVGTSRRDRLAEVLRAVEGSHALTVSDIDGFALRGGIIALSRENARLRPVINTAALARAGLTASSKLLSLATLVSAREDGK